MPEGFARDPELVLRFYDMRREAIQTKQPEPRMRRWRGKWTRKRGRRS